MDNGFSPYIAVHVDPAVQVPMEHVKNGEIVLNMSVDATSALRLGNDFIEFKARFGGVSRDIIVPVSHVVAIYARENGQGMAFPAPATTVLTDVSSDSGTSGEGAAGDSRANLRAVPSDGEGGGGIGLPPDDLPPDKPPKGGGRPHLKRVK